MFCKIRGIRNRTVIVDMDYNAQEKVIMSWGERELKASPVINNVTND